MSPLEFLQRLASLAPSAAVTRRHPPLDGSSVVLKSFISRDDDQLLAPTSK